MKDKDTLIKNLATTMESTVVGMDVYSPVVAINATVIEKNIKKTKVLDIPDMSRPN